jgi:hypothetical protein
MIGLLLALASRSTAAPNSPVNGLRDIRIGMPVADVTDTGDSGFACASDTNHKLRGWPGWRWSTFDSLRLRPETRRDGTVVAGHSVILTLLVDHAGIVAS